MAKTVSYQGATFSQDGKGLYVVSDASPSSSGSAIWTWLLRSTLCLTEDIPWDIESIRLSEDGQWLAFTAKRKRHE
jgi:dipeptidyl aminopeptidase/acylaminoacyl peptidase